MNQTSLAGRAAAACAPASRGAGAGASEERRAVTRQPGRASRRGPSLVVAVATASLSGIVILLYALHWVTLTYTIRVLAPLTALVYSELLVHARRGPEDVFVNRLAGGLLAGVVGWVAYDFLRLLLPRRRGPTRSNHDCVGCVLMG